MKYCRLAALLACLYLSARLSQPRLPRVTVRHLQDLCHLANNDLRFWQSGARERTGLLGGLRRTGWFSNFGALCLNNLLCPKKYLEEAMF